MDRIMDQDTNAKLNTTTIVVTYAIVGGLWILFSDNLLVMLVKDPETLIRFQLFKGWFFIIVTTILLWFLIQKSMRVLGLEETKKDKFKGRQEVAESLLGVLEILNSNTKLPEILDYIVAQASKLLRADAAAIYQPHKQKDLLIIQASHGLSEEYIAHVNIPFGQLITGRATKTKRTIFLSDLKTQLADSDFTADEKRLDLYNEVAERFRAVMAVPLVSNGDEVSGSLTLYYEEPREFSKEDIVLAESFATHVSLGINNALLRRQVKKNAITEERTRIARELHDTVSQSIYSAMLYTDATRLALSSGKENTVKENLNELRTTTHKAMLDMRLLIFELHPPILEKEGLVAAIQTRLDSVEVRSGVQATLLAEGESRLPTEIEFELYRIIQEALTNIVKHAGASEVGVKLLFTDNGVHLEVWDNGVGFETSTAKDSGGFGLGNISDRAAMINGKLSVQSSPGAGTILCLDIDV